jgi:hypothetical protein
MGSCTFFSNASNLEDTEISIKLTSSIYDTFEYLIVKKNVSVFYALSKTPFELYCHAVLTTLQKQYKNIEIVEFADTESAKDKANPHCVVSSKNDYDENCRFSANASNYIVVYDMDEALKNELYAEIILKNTFSENPSKIIDLYKNTEKGNAQQNVLK